MSKYRSATIVALSVAALALLGFFVAYTAHLRQLEAGVASSATAAWFVLLAGMGIAGALAAWLIRSEKLSSLAAQQRSDRLQLEMQLVAARKVETLAQLAGGIAHDFNNVLMTISGYADLALSKNEDDDDPEMREYLNLMSVSADNGSVLIRKLLSISRGKSHRRGLSVELAPALRNTVEQLARMLPQQVALQVEIGDAVPTVNIDSLTLEQIIVNLVMNAVEASGARGTIGISLAPASAGERRCNACQKSFGGEFVRLIVRDEGKGIAVENIDELFQPFYTTKTDGKGSGLGLALLQNLVHGIDGHIELASAPGKGTAVSVYIPLPPASSGTAGTGH